jgi:hypothetical protein
LLCGGAARLVGRRRVGVRRGTEAAAVGRYTLLLLLLLFLVGALLMLLPLLLVCWRCCGLAEVSLLLLLLPLLLLALVSRCCCSCCGCCGRGGCGVKMEVRNFDSQCPHVSACVRICPHLSACVRIFCGQSALCPHCVRMCPRCVRNFFHDFELERYHLSIIVGLLTI